MRTILNATTALLLLGAAATGVDAANPCPDQPVHTYSAGASGGASSATVTGGNDATVTSPAGKVSVWDTNSSECDGDANTTADWDGDYDAGIGGGAFGYGAWAEDPDCNFGLNLHGPNVFVNDLFFASAVAFVVGEDDQSGPVKIPIFTSVDVDADARYSPPIRPVPTEWVCETNGSITPCPDNDPAQCGPTDDADDCLSAVFVGTGHTCGTGGGDGMYWVFVLTTHAQESGSLGVSNPPTWGTITAF